MSVIVGAHGGILLGPHGNVAVDQNCCCEEDGTITNCDQCPGPPTCSLSTAVISGIPVGPAGSDLSGLNGSWSLTATGPGLCQWFKLFGNISGCSDISGNGELQINCTLTGGPTRPIQVGLDYGCFVDYLWGANIPATLSLCPKHGTYTLAPDPGNIAPYNVPITITLS